MISFRQQTSNLPRSQQGMSLLVVLVLLLVMSILGVAVLRSSAMQERMSANMRDRNDAMQAAETGLIRAQEDAIRGTFNAMWDGNQDFQTLRSSAGKTCAGNGVCDRSGADPDKLVTPSIPTFWDPVKSGDYNGPRYGYIVEYLGVTKGESSEVQGVCNTTAPPKYLCERPMFRVTVYGRGKGLAQVVLQSIILSQAQ